jgi:hypothetical protein
MQIFPVPDPGFNPVGSPRSELARFGFLPEPDRQVQRSEYALWSRLFFPGLTFVQASISFVGAQRVRSGAARPAMTGTRHQDSSNWSGGYIKPRNGRMFTWLYGEWTVPPVSAPPTAPAGSFFSSSTWIGLDGQRRYLHSSLPQIGTSQTAIAGQPPQPPTTWFQWWARDQQNCFVTLPLVVNANDQVRCLMVVLSATQVLFTMLNVNTLTLLLPFIVTAPTTSLGLQLRVSGATAEWIMERPADCVTGVPFDLAKFGVVDFVNSVAISARSPSSPFGRTENVVGARLIDTFKTSRNPYRAVTISKADRIGTDEITATYVP